MPAAIDARPPLSDELVRPSKQPRRREAPSRRVSLGWRQDYRWDDVEATLCLPKGGQSNGGLHIDLFSNQATVPPVRVRLHMSEAALTALQFPFGWQDADRIDRIAEFCYLSLVCLDHARSSHTPRVPCYTPKGGKRVVEG